MKSYKLKHRIRPLCIFFYENLLERRSHIYDDIVYSMDRGDCILARIPKSKLIQEMYGK